HPASPDTSTLSLHDALPISSVTEATGKGDGSITVTAEESRLLPLVPRINRPPAARAWTTPVELTVARATFVLAQLTALGGRLFDMTTLALSCRLSPTSTEAVFG